MQNNTALALLPLTEVERMATAIARSGLFGAKTPDQALALMLVAQAEGMHPASAAKDYHIIQGRPCLKADAMLSRFQASGGSVKWNSYTDQKVEAVFAHPQGGTVTIEWTMERAKAAGLTGKDTWRAYPRQMLRARVISEGIRTVFPAVCSGTYTPEEIQDMDEPRNITPEPEKPKKAKPEPKPGQKPVIEEAVITQEPQPEPTISKTETVARPAAAPTITNSAEAIAGKVKKVRSLFSSLGVKTVEDFRNAIMGLLGKQVQGLSDLSGDELDAVIADLERQAA